MSWDKAFIEVFNSIRGFVISGMRLYPFDWLESKKAMAVIKNWKGKPVDVLAYLTRHGFIEQAVRRQLMKDTAK
jgi:hypothetical protein